eukprot:PhF_6_TR1426/c0_g1_i5/m.2516
MQRPPTKQISNQPSRRSWEKSWQAHSYSLVLLRPLPQYHLPLRQPQLQPRLPLPRLPQRRFPQHNNQQQRRPPPHFFLVYHHPLTLFWNESQSQTSRQRTHHTTCLLKLKLRLRPPSILRWHNTKSSLSPSSTLVPAAMMIAARNSAQEPSRVLLLVF